MARLTPQQRDDARRRVGTATMSITILAAGATGAATILAWNATEEAKATSSTVSGQDGSGTASVLSGAAAGQDDQVGDTHDDGDGRDGDGRDDEGGTSYAVVPGAGQNGSVPQQAPQQAPQKAPPPAAGSGGGAVRSQGS